MEDIKIDKIEYLSKEYLHRGLKRLMMDDRIPAGANLKYKYNLRLRNVCILKKMAARENSHQYIFIHLI